MSARYFSPNSRYKIDETGIAADRIPPIRVTAFLYTVKQGDTLESIASKQLGDPLRYWEIADINPQITFPLSLKTGDVIRVPS
jgi:nucleoid-associated protein YgaU